MNSECNFTVKSSYRQKILGIFVWFLLSSAFLLMVWATIFYKPEEWYVVVAWSIAFFLSLLSLYIGITSRATLTANNQGVKYVYKYLRRGKVELQLKWSDIELFRTYRSSAMDGTTAGGLVPKSSRPLEIGIVYSELYKNGERTKWENILMNDDEVHYYLPLSMNFKNKEELVDRLNICKSKHSDLK